MHTRVIVVPAAPHYRGPDGEPRFWPGRVQKGIELALRHDCPVIFAGDANGGSDLRRSANLAREAGVPEAHIFEAFNGHEKRWKNTRGDALVSAKMVSFEGPFEGVEEVIVVTCWYHMPRFQVALRQMFRRMTCTPPRFRSAPVWANMVHGTHRLLSPYGELRGIWDYVRNNPQTSRGQWAHEGKPGFSGS